MQTKVIVAILMAVVGICALVVECAPRTVRSPGETYYVNKSICERRTMETCKACCTKSHHYSDGIEKNHGTSCTCYSKTQQSGSDMSSYKPY